MSIVKRISSQQLNTRTHDGWFLACPIHLWQPSPMQTPTLSERNWIPAWWFRFNVGVWRTWCQVIEMFDPDYNPNFPIIAKAAQKET